MGSAAVITYFRQRSRLGVGSSQPENVCIVQTFWRGDRFRLSCGNASVEKPENVAVDAGRADESANELFRIIIVLEIKIS